MVKCLPCNHGNISLISPNARVRAQAYNPSTSTTEAETKGFLGFACQTI